MDERFYVGVKFDNNAFNYFFATDDENLRQGNQVVVETTRGLEIGTVAFAPLPIESYKHPFELKPIIRVADADDLLIQNENRKKSIEALEIAKKDVKALNLDMRLLGATFSLDGTKVTFTFVADERIDFRELVKQLAYRFRCRIELKQIGPRDKSKMTGGIGVCGLPLCCATFLSEMETISINRAKNQMLSLNIPKLSGPCGKLMCCLTYEDEVYNELKKQFPRIGENITIEEIKFKVDSINLFSKEIKLVGEEEVKILSLDEFNDLNKTVKKERK